MIDPKVYAQALFQAVSETVVKEHDKVLENFVRILNQNGDIGLYQQIEQEYQNLERQSKGIREVSISTASNVDPKKIIDHLNKVIGGKAEIKHKIDESLIGGVVVRVDDTLIDASLKTSLQKLRKNIAQ